MADCPVGEDKSLFSGIGSLMGNMFLIPGKRVLFKEGCTIVVEKARIFSMPVSEYLIGDIVLLQEGIQA
jgi:hypothetical protein